MGIVFRQSIKTTIVNFAGAVLGAIVMFGYSYVLSAREMGFTRSMLAQCSILQYMVLFGTSSAVLTFLHRYNTREKQGLLLTMAAIVPIVVTALLFIPYCLFKEQIIDLYKLNDRAYVHVYYIWPVVLLLLWAYMTQLEGYLLSQNKSAISSFMREVVLKMLNVVLIILVWCRLISFPIFLVATVLVYAIPALILLFIAMRTEDFRLSLNWRAFSGDEYKALIKFCWYHVLMGISILALGQVDLFMLGIMGKNGLSTLGAYTNAVFITAVMTVPYRAMTMSAYPSLNKAYSAGDKGEVKELFHRSAINILIVGMLMAVIIGCNLHNAVAILPAGKGFEAIPPLVLIMMFGRLVDMASGLNSELINMSEYYRFNFGISTFLLVLLIGLNYILIPHFDIYGAAWGGTLALIMFNICKMYFLWKKMNLIPFGKGSLLVLLAGGITALAGYFLPHLPNPILDTMIRTVLVSIVYILLMVWLKPSTDLQVYLQSIKEKKRLF